MNIEELREFGLSLPYATERMPFGPDTYCLEVAGKIFCLATLDGEWDFYNLKVDPEYSEELRLRFGGITPGYHMNKKHWVSVKYSGDIPDALQRELILHSYQQVLKKVPKKVRTELGLSPD
ncbi:MAG: MmcQ/YjbR family DNA-binding protein [Muribaculaceae bacterium]|nr:MmcQ/YjbR family DNA-binding protein [Muribaculaceae bacterium]